MFMHFLPTSANVILCPFLARLADRGSLESKGLKRDLCHFSIKHVTCHSRHVEGRKRRSCVCSSIAHCLMASCAETHQRRVKLQASKKIRFRVTCVRLCLVRPEWFSQASFGDIRKVLFLSPPVIFPRKHGKHKSVCLQVVCDPLDFAIFVRMIMAHMMFSICSTNPFYAVELVVGQLETKDNGLEDSKLEDLALSRLWLSRGRSLVH